MRDNEQQQTFVDWFRHSSPYIRAFRGRTFVVTFGGEMLAEAQFANLVHDLVLLHSLGIKLVLVHGARPQIDAQLKARKLESQYANGMRITDEPALECVKQAAGSVRVEIEAQLSVGISNMPMHKVTTHVISGNFVTAQPLGVRQGVDYCHTGEVRRIDVDAIKSHLDNNSIVLLGPMGYSPTGEVFNLNSEDVATEVARRLRADKLIIFTDENFTNGKRQLFRELTPREVQEQLSSKRKIKDNTRRHMENAMAASMGGVNRVHVLNRHVDGAVLLELFTRDGIGTLVSAQSFEDIRQATIDDIGGILDLISPLEQEGILVRRSRERIEMEIAYFTVVERDGLIIACAAFYTYAKDKLAELACLAVHPDYRQSGRGHVLFDHIVKQATQMGIEKLFVLTTRTAHWFRERGFKAADIKDLPIKKRTLYNYQRQSKVFIKDLT